MEQYNEEQNKEGLSFENRIDLSELQASVLKIKKQLQKVIVGQKEMVDLLLVSLLANGHVLIEGVPGVAKTITAKLLSKTINVDFSRIQFTPDLMPSDILGTSVFNAKNSDFEFKKGPIFSNMVLIDEINRAPAKTQAALFEVMEEKQITMDGTTYKMDEPFVVLATQNPIEQEGTYRLPEAQLDRFLFKVVVEYPNADEELEIIMKEQALENKTKASKIETIIEGSKIVEYRALVNQVKIEENLLKYIANVVVNTRSNSFLYLGASPRASIAILNASKVFAAIEGRDFVTPEDIKKATVPVLQHRVIVTPEREMEGLTSKQIIEQIIETVEIPR
ncbi:AAA family ATPase [Polaribacter dokdonensis]|uniref:ATPase family associated with various cellular activities (AAA) n=1 Tax=Polaribacter dokdonensis DSW-5 TaxID=1300348 RepID=A0A0N0UNW5_9FLAO|nr:MoxR family ATPase [Polaribacter dokdonensis]KOY52660.1 ATPase family associated with various cellular activities (AAA) [Polaribacter dokdonensis DSW-5]SEE49859.1 MoxR-like ATPase [Polaribacter dokdonensis DSW-5]